MTRARLLVWLIALLALVAPPAMAAQAMVPSGQAASVHCPDHAPPPDPCPAKGTAKHAAGDCCPLMSGAVALLPPPAAIGAPVVFLAPVPAAVGSLAGRTFSQDPPPPRA